MSSRGTARMIEVLRGFADDGNASTHYGGCWEYHPRCAMSVAADMLEEADRPHVVSDKRRERGWAQIGSAVAVVGYWAACLGFHIHPYFAAIALAIAGVGVWDIWRARQRTVHIVS